VDGKYDDVPEPAFCLVGKIEEAREQGEKLKEAVVRARSPSNVDCFRLASNRGDGGGEKKA
jgi:hypothetical protein